MPGRALFLDRDGVINVDHGYVHRAADFDFVPGIFDLVGRASGLGFRPVVVTNQSGIARGLFEPHDFAVLTDWMLRRFADRGTPLAAVMHCPFLAGGRRPFDRDSFWRKPNPGMILEAAVRLDVDPGRSVFVGDRTGDMIAARSAGVGLRIGFGPDVTEADLTVNDLTKLARDLPGMVGPLLSGVSSRP